MDISGNYKNTKKYYRRYSYLDVIYLEDVEIRQSRRDLEFEKWLSQLNIDIRPHLYSVVNIPTKIAPRWWRPFYKFFHMEIVTTIVSDKHEIILNRTHNLSIISSIKGNIRMSDKNDIIQRCEFKTGGYRLQEEKNVVKPIAKNRVSLGESGSIFIPVGEPKIQKNQPYIVKIRGAEIDESF